MRAQHVRDRSAAIAEEQQRSQQLRVHRAGVEELLARAVALGDPAEARERLPGAAQGGGDRVEARREALEPGDEFPGELRPQAPRHEEPKGLGSAGIAAEPQAHPLLDPPRYVPGREEFPPLLVLDIRLPVREERLIGAMDPIPVTGEGGLERRCSVVAQGAREGVLFPGFLGKAVGLLLLPDLEAVLHTPQEPIGLSQGLGLLRGHEFEARECLQGAHGRVGLQERELPGRQELERLRDEFHLANAARPLLHVEGEPLQAHPFALGAPLHRRDLAQKARGRPPGIPEGVQVLEDLGPEGDVARRGAGLEEGEPLPGLPCQGVVALEPLAGLHQGAVGAVRPQADVRPEQESVLRARIEGLRHPFGDLRVELHARYR